MHPFPDQCVSSNSRIKSCENCRLSNRKCSKEEVCERCTAKGLACNYTRNSTRNKMFKELKRRQTVTDQEASAPLTRTTRGKRISKPVAANTPTTVQPVGGRRKRKVVKSESEPESAAPLATPPACDAQHHSTSQQQYQHSAVFDSISSDTHTLIHAHPSIQQFTPNFSELGFMLPGQESCVTPDFDLIGQSVHNNNNNEWFVPPTQLDVALQASPMPVNCMSVDAMLALPMPSWEDLAVYENGYF
ncbi:hypothetical protein HDU77_011057 [Chytriomyces hyalinus]|nr:hypothetical protein HDU77_011057 [Chytriomyces hyalinus]